MSLVHKDVFKLKL